MEDMLVLIYTSGHAFMLEKKLKEQGIAVRLGPIPRGISSDCGVCAYFYKDDLAAVQSCVAGLPFEIQGIVEKP